MPTRKSAAINTGLPVRRASAGAFDKGDGTWMVLPVNSQLVAGEEILSLPTYRPQVLISQAADIVGEAAFKLHVLDAANLARVAIKFGGQVSFRWRNGWRHRWSRARVGCLVR
jgi:hypothetical protein